MGCTKFLLWSQPAGLGLAPVQPGIGEQGILCQGVQVGLVGIVTLSSVEVVIINDQVGMERSRVQAVCDTHIICMRVKLD